MSTDFNRSINVCAHCNCSYTGPLAGADNIARCPWCYNVISIQEFTGCLRMLDICMEKNSKGADEKQKEIARMYYYRSEQLLNFPPVDAKKAFECCQIAANYGCMEAILNLGYYYQNGECGDYIIYRDSVGDSRVNYTCLLAFEKYFTIALLGMNTVFDLFGLTPRDTEQRALCERLRAYRENESNEMKGYYNKLTCTALYDIACMCHKIPLRDLHTIFTASAFGVNGTSMNAEQKEKARLEMVARILTYLLDPKFKNDLPDSRENIDAMIETVKAEICKYNAE